MQINREKQVVSTQEKAAGREKKMPYKKMFIMVILSFIAMYILMYSMVDRLPNVIPNINQIYMAGLMTMPMVLIELLVMKSMYKIKSLNIILLSVTTIASFLFFLGIRHQTFVKDKQFLKSMIPHHAAAILMVKEATLTDPEVQQLGQEIIASQQKEIDFMKAKIKKLEDK
jgi:hypothetical protein